MTVNTTTPSVSRRTRTVTRRTFWTVLLAAAVALCAAVMEARFQGLETTDLRIGETPVTVTRLHGQEARPPVIVAHGFAGSRQMMDQISVSLARQGFLVASVDLPGHGRNGVPMSPDITRIEGTTADLVKTVGEVAEAIVARTDTAGPVSFVGHSMATDVVIRAAQARDDVGGVVAISMYSPAVTATSPKALLVVSGAREAHLRAAGLATLHQIDPNATEQQTVTLDGVIRRSAVAPFVGHVGVLYAGASLDEITGWLRQVTGSGQPAQLDRTGWIAGLLLLALVLLFWPLSHFVPARAQPAAASLSSKSFLASILLPLPVALGIAALPTFGIAGYAAFGSLGLILGVWGVIQLWVLHRAGHSIARPDPLGLAAYLAASLVFALALDRYGAAFLPGGDRVIVLAGLMIGTVPLMLADTALAHGATVLRRVLTRLALLVGLAGAMALSPTQLGLTFTVLPVLVLFFLVYGTMAHWLAVRRGAGAVGLGKGIVLAWAIAASTPLFALAGAG